MFWYTRYSLLKSGLWFNCIIILKTNIIFGLSSVLSKNLSLIFLMWIYSELTFTTLLDRYTIPHWPGTSWKSLKFRIGTTKTGLIFWKFIENSRKRPSSASKVRKAESFEKKFGINMFILWLFKLSMDVNVVKLIHELNVISIWYK